MIHRLLKASSDFVTSVRDDYEAVRSYRSKYNADSKSWAEFPVDVVRKVGVQMMVAVRVMHFVRDAGIPLAPQIAARMIRHLYGADIHWDAELAPGISIIHGQGLIISSSAKVAKGCILFQGVTLGEGRDSDTGAIGAPTIAEDVHIGPNTVILGPIEVGTGTKIGAGSVLTKSVPELSLVQPAEARVTKRLKTNETKEARGRGEHA